MFIDSDLFKTDKQSNLVEKDSTYLADLIFSLFLLVSTTLTDFDQLCRFCIESKSIRTVLQKNMIPTTSKLKEVHANL